MESEEVSAVVVVDEAGVEVLVVGAGPVGLMTAIELRRRGVDVLLVDQREEPAPWAKAVGVQPRTLEIFDALGIIRPALDAATSMRGQLRYVDGVLQGRIDMELPDDVPYRFVSIPQYATEQVLHDLLVGLGGTVHRGITVTAIEPDEDGVTATLTDGSGSRQLRADYLVGCDGAHSLARKAVGIGFEGDAFPESYMLADVEVDWDLPAGYAVRCQRRVAGAPDDQLVCIPLPGEHRYRMSMLVAEDLRGGTDAGSTDGIEHGLGPGRTPELHHVQAVLDRLSPQPTTARHLRWSSVFRISHRLAERYAQGRVLLAGDAAHIHPPTGGQGMNTGLQDAFNLGWKLAAAVHGLAGPGLLASYHAERHPVGAEVVGRTVAAARGGGVGVGSSVDPTTLMQREAQLLVAYPDSPLVGEDVVDGVLTDGPRPGSRAPDARGLRQDPVTGGLRVHDLFRHPGHTLLLWANGPAELGAAKELSACLAGLLPAGLVRSCVLVAADLEVDDLSGRVFRDAEGLVAQAYGFGVAPAGVVASYLVRPDLHVGHRSSAVSVGQLLDHLTRSYGTLAKDSDR